MDRPPPHATILAHAAHILRTRGLAVVAPAFGAGLAFAFGFCLITLPMGVWMLGRASRACLPQPAPPRGFVSELCIGALAFLSVLPFLGSLVIAALFLQTYPAESPMNIGALALQVAIASVGTAALAPWLGAADIFAAEDLSIREALARSLSTAVRAGLARCAAIAALSGLVLSLPVLALQLIGGIAGLALAIVGSLAAWVLALVLARALALAPSRNPGRTSSVFAVPLLALVATALAVISVAPPAWQALDPACTLAEVPVEARFGDEAHHEEVEYVRGGVWIRGLDRAHDAFLRRRRLPDLEHGLWSGPVSCTEPSTGVIVAVFGDGPGALGGRFAPGGRRLDDAPRDRLAARANLFTNVALVLAACLACASLARAHRRARALCRGMPRRLTVRLGPAASLERTDTTLSPRGEVRLETPDASLVSRLDRPVPTTSSASSLEDGDEVLVVLPRALAELGPRQGATTIPEGTWIADADADVDAARVSHSVRDDAVFMLASVLTALLGASIALLLL